MPADLLLLVTSAAVAGFARHHAGLSCNRAGKQGDAAIAAGGVPRPAVSRPAWRQVQTEAVHDIASTICKRRREQRSVNFLPGSVSPSTIKFGHEFNSLQKIKPP